MDEFAGRLTPVGWLGVQHVNGISRSTNDPNRDVANLDLEVMILWALWREKVQNEKAFKGKADPQDPTDLGWDHLADVLGELETEVREKGMDPGVEAARRLEIRVLQLQVLMASAVQSGLTDMAHLPKDVFNARGT